MPYLCCVERQTAASPIEALKPTAVKVKPLLKMRNLSEVFSKFDGVVTKGMNRKGGMFYLSDSFDWYRRGQTFECVVAVPSAKTFEEAVAHLKKVAKGVSGKLNYDNYTGTKDVYYPTDEYDYARWETEPDKNPSEPTWVHVSR